MLGYCELFALIILIQINNKLSMALYQTYFDFVGNYNGLEIQVFLFVDRFTPQK